MLFSPKCNNLFLSLGIQEIISNPFAVSIYSGTQADAADITANFANYNSASANYLAHYNGITWTRPNDGAFMMFGLSVTATPDNTGTGTWAILRASNVARGVMDGTALPNGSFIVCKVSDQFGDGVIRFADTNFVTGTPKAYVDGSLSASS